MCVSFTLQQVGEEALDEILRVSWTIAASAREGVQRRPVIATKPGQGRVRCLVVVSASIDNAPVSSSKGRAAILDSARNPFHIERILRSNTKWQVRSTAPERRRAAAS